MGNKMTKGMRAYAQPMENDTEAISLGSLLRKLGAA